MKLFIAGHQGLVGSAVSRAAEATKRYRLIQASRKTLDLTDRFAVMEFFEKNKPDAVVMAAAKVGGIIANQVNPVSFMSENLQIQTNVIDAAATHEVERFVFLGSSCVYPKHCNQPITEDDLLTGPLEETNQAYAVAKIAGVESINSYRKQYGRSWVSLMPTNLYGPGDNFDSITSHVIPGMLRKIHQAHVSGDDEVVLWGTGSPLREFLHVDDLAKAILLVLENTSPHSIMNVGSGSEISIESLSQLICDLVGFQGRVRWDISKPDGTPRKLLDSSRISELGWRPIVDLREGVAQTYLAFQELLQS